MMPKPKRGSGLSEVSTDAKRKKEACRGSAAEHSVQASLDPAGMTLDVEVATDISLGGDPRECCEARVQSKIVQPKTVLLRIECPHSCKFHPKCMHRSQFQSTVQLQRTRNKVMKTTRVPHQMITRLRAARMGQDHPPNQPVQTSNGQYVPIRQGAACMAPEETTTQTSLTSSGRPRPSAP